MDADCIIKYLQDAQKKKSFGTEDSCGTWFLFAVHLNQKGMKDQANELAGLLFEIGKGKRKVILQALNALADVQYYAAYAEAIFRQSMGHFRHAMEKYGEH